MFQISVVHFLYIENILIIFFSGLQHIDILFYYLRRKGRVFSKNCLRFITTDNFFDQRFQGLYERYLSSGKNVSVVGMNHYAAEYILGYLIACNTIWLDVDHVLFPIFVAKEKH